MKNKFSYLKIQTTVLLSLSLVVGYHYFYEGIDKLFSSNWSSAPFLLQANWVFSDILQYLASSQTLLNVVDTLNIWGQILLGISLVIGLYSVIAALFGAFFFFSYYIVVPPFIESYTFIDKKVLELLGFLKIVLFLISNLIGLDFIIEKYRRLKHG